ncbi:uncharacterized protein LOC142771614 [Rhipicephalus microplus]|uniref:uncharacterized protein LOC142771614 n=1 Tax=Rhipicephalus microplus TaxID=6941 RepID=UPI003F6C466A
MVQGVASRALVVKAPSSPGLEIDSAKGDSWWQRWDGGPPVALRQQSVFKSPFCFQLECFQNTLRTKVWPDRARQFVAFAGVLALSPMPRTLARDWCTRRRLQFSATSCTPRFGTSAYEISRHCARP